MYIQCKIETVISRVRKGIAALCKMHFVELGELVLARYYIRREIVYMTNSFSLVTKEDMPSVSVQSLSTETASNLQTYDTI